jgi:small conductance mechanosensitive channel
LGAAGLAIGLALQGTLSNLAAGVMLLLFRPFRVGHFVEIAGQAGTVKEVGLFTTELATPDNVQIIVPNGDVWGTAVTNFSAHDTRRVDLVAGISYNDDIGAAMDVLKRAIDGEPRILRDPEPFMAVTNLGDFSVDITLRLWCKSSDYWGVKFDMTRRIKEDFDKNGVDIPFPTQTHLQKSAN